MKAAVIAGDFIGFTVLSGKFRSEIRAEVNKLFDLFTERYDAYCRLVKGDYVEIVVNPQYAFRVVLLLKNRLKTVAAKIPSREMRVKYFKKIVLRLVVSVGELEVFDPSGGIIEGEAVYEAGRFLAKEYTHDKKRISIKQSMFFISSDPHLTKEMDTLFALTDYILMEHTPKQAAVVYYRLLGMDFSEIARQWGVSRESINALSIRAGWYHIHKALDYYEYRFQNFQ